MQARSVSYSWTLSNHSLKGFGKKENRFGYESLRKVRRDQGKIDGPSDSEIEKTKMRTSSYSFGVSRSQMNKIHVDEILKKTGELVPGPDKYEKKDLFGGT